MSRFPELQNFTDNISLFSPGKARLWVVLTFLMVFMGGNVVGQNGFLISSTVTSPTSFNPVPITFKFDQPVNLFTINDINVTNGVLNNFMIETPEFSFLNFYNLDSFTVSTGNYETELKKTVISVDVNSKGDIFLLTQGNGIKKLSADGTVQSFPVGGNYFTSPIDIAIKSNDEIYVADNSSRKIYVFAPDGTPLPNKTLGSGFNGGNRTEFRGPMGLDFDDEDNLFIADRYEGGSTETFERNMIKIYYANGSYYEFYGRSTTDKFNIPYRVALDKRGYLYVSDIANNNPRVQVFDISEEGTTSYITTIGENEIDSPGSIAIDDYGFIYIADFGEKVNIVDIFDLEGSDVFKILGTINSVISGIDTEVFNIKVFDSEFNFRETIIEEIDLPVDLALDKCGKLFVNNANISSGGFLKYNFDFDLEIYNRLPDSFLASFTIEQECIPAILRILGGAANNVSCLGTTATNEFQMVWDQTKPVTDCPTSIVTISKNSAGKYILPDYTNLASDNCDPDLSVAQNPLPGEITSNTPVIITATDNAGNVSEICSFSVEILEEPKPSFSCPVVTDVPDLFFDSNCNFIEPDLSGLLSGFMNFKNTPHFVQTSNRTNNILVVKIKVYDGLNGNLIDECNFEVNLVDNLKPIINCPISPQTISKNGAGKYILPDYSNLASDNCDPDLSVTQNPLQGEIISNTAVTITATDAAGNVSDACTFMVNLTENEMLEITCPSDQVGQLDLNCQSTIPDYRGFITVNFQNAIITQSPLAGTIVSETITIKLTATLNGQTDDCMFQLILEDAISPVVNCVGEYSLSLNANGIANLSAAQIDFNSTDNCGIASMVIDKTLFTFNDLGENTVTLTVTDTAGNVDSCTTIVRVLIGNYVPGDFECKSPVVIQLDETGNASISSSDLYTGDPGDRNFVLSKTSFNCSNIGNNPVDFSYTGNDGSGTCGINVIVEDRISPEARTRNINVTLSSSGTATITPEMIDNGSTDNCGTPQLSLDVTTFNCDNLGENTVFLSASDVSGNFTIKPATVTVSGNCKEIPETGFEYIFIYPNPTPGPFTFDTPTGWSIEKVEVYDARGRYVLTETYSENQIEYSMDLRSLQQAVYILKLYTSQGIKILRVIIN